MITDIVSHDGSIMISGGCYQPVYVGAVCDNSQPQIGDVRYNGTTFETYTDGSWVKLQDNICDLQIGPRWQPVLEWAEGKMVAEEKEKELLEKSPALRKAKENYDMIKALIENDQ